MRRLALLLLLLPGLSAASDFDNLVREFGRQTGAQQTKIPFLGLTRFAVAAGRPKGVSEFKMAVFENIGNRQRDFIGSANLVASGSGWQRLIHVRSQAGESTDIYAHPDGKHLRMMIATVDQSDAVFMEMRITPDRLMDFLDEHQGKTASR